MWIFSDEEIIKIQNRMNDLWEESNMSVNEASSFISCANRLLGSLDAIMTPSHYYKKELK